MKKRRILLSALIVMLLWGTLFPLIKLSYRGFSVVTTWDTLLFAGARFVISGGGIVLLQALRKPKTFRPLVKAWFPTLRMALYSVVLHYGFFYLGLTFVESGRAAVLQQVGTLFYVCCSPLFFREDRLTSVKVMGAVLGFFGIVVMNWDGSRVVLGIGQWLIIATSLSNVFSSVVGKKLCRTADPVTATGVSQLLGGAVLLAAGLAGGGRLQVAEPWAIPVMLYIVLATCVSYCLWYSAVQKAELSGLFIIKFAEPVFALIFSALLLGEALLDLRKLAAAVLIAGGIALTNQKKALPILHRNRRRIKRRAAGKHAANP